MQEEQHEPDREDPETRGSAPPTTPQPGGASDRGTDAADNADASDQERWKPDMPKVAGFFGGAIGPVLAVVTLLGLPWPAILVAAAVCLVDLVLLAHRLASLRGATAVGRESRYGALMTVIALSIVAFAVVPFVLVNFRFGGPHLWPWRGLALSAAALAATVHVSAMIDWAYIRLRLLGTLGDWSLPCQSEREGAANWRWLTRIWLGHRITALLFGRIALAVVISFGVAEIVVQTSSTTRSAPAKTAMAASATTPSRAPQTTTGANNTRRSPKTNTTTTAGKARDKGSSGLTQSELTALGTVVAALLVFFINRFLPFWSLVSNPRLSVGDRVVLAEEYGTGVDTRPTYYVVDVAYEGIKLLQLDRRGLPTGSNGQAPGREHDRSLALADAPRLLRVRGRYTGCDQKCSKAHFQCPLKLGADVVRPLAKEPRLKLVKRVLAFRRRPLDRAHTQPAPRAAPDAADPSPSPESA